MQNHDSAEVATAMAAADYPCLDLFIAMDDALTDKKYEELHLFVKQVWGQMADKIMHDSEAASREQTMALDLNAVADQW